MEGTEPAPGARGPKCSRDQLRGRGGSRGDQLSWKQRPLLPCTRGVIPGKAWPRLPPSQLTQPPFPHPHTGPAPGAHVCGRDERPLVALARAEAAPAPASTEKKHGQVGGCGVLQRDLGVGPQSSWLQMSPVMGTHLDGEEEGGSARPDGSEGHSSGGVSVQSHRT